ncbi:MAG: hypothetical protein II922_06645 [Succinimonas sp.]|nr:hypothetical protein [Succinimonas sp.]
MRCFVMQTSQYESEAKKYNCVNFFKRFKRDAESYIDYCHPAEMNFSFGNYIKKRLSNFRIILAYRNMTVENQQVRCYVALKVFTRGDKDYEEFYTGSTADEKRESLVGMRYADWDAYEKIIAEKLKAHDDPVELPDLDPYENNYIQRGSGITHTIFDTKIIESKYWLETTRSASFKDPMKVIDALLEMIDEALYADAYGFIEKSFGEAGKKILCLRPEPDPDDPKADNYYLLKLGTDEDIKAFKEEHKLGGAAPDMTELENMSVRAYPYSMLEGDKDFWWDMEKDENSNFILSPEELDIVSREIQFPLFLTGRAGSGKSTMLQYLFAEYFLRYLEHLREHPPVYISYSSNLIENAKKLAVNLYTRNHAYTKKLKEIKLSFDDDIKPHFDSSFHVFQQLVKQFIEDSVPGTVQKRFTPNHHVTYARFRDLWLKKFNKDPAAAEKFGPAVSWHVIRTYIKGWNADEYLSPELYENIGKSYKSVSDEVFKTVYDVVWEKWYSGLQDDEGLWDDQDLVRYCLAPDDDSCETCVKPKFSAIFCDESQDFTRTEIEFILQISIFSQRRVYDEKTLFKLPFVFAGDEFQTLNPTGFSWNSLRSYFTTRLIRVTMSKNVGAPDPVVLKHNYRSPAAITKLANRLQLLRQTRCGYDEKFTPQIPYHCQEKPDPVLCLSPANPLVWKELSKMGTVLIIPCSEGQSPKDFIQNSPIKDFVEFYEDGSAKSITIYNPAQAKGLEYPRVAIYGFDRLKELRIHNLQSWYSSDNPEPDTESREIEMKYFLSNAYVSATRASNKLFILTDFNDESFWTFAFASDDPLLQDQITEVNKRMIAKSKWECDNALLGFIVKGDVDDISKIGLLNLEEIARGTKARAMDLLDAGLMRQAAARYREQNNMLEVTTCEAYAFRYDRDFRQAAENFEKIQDYANALDDYWSMDADNKTELRFIVESISKLAGKTSDLRVTLSQHAIKKRVTLNEFKMDLSNLKEKLATGAEKLLDNLNSDIWSAVLNLILRNIPNTTTVNKNDLDPILNMAEELDKKYYIEVNKNELALMAFKAEEFARAVAIWEKLKARPKEFYQAQCRLLPYPANLAYREQTEDPSWMEQVVEDFRSDRNAVLEPYQRKIVARSFVAKGAKEEIPDNLMYLWTNALDLREAKEYGNLARQNGFRYAEDCIEALFIYRWGDVANAKLSHDKYISTDLNLLMETLTKIREIRTPAFLETVNKVLRLRGDGDFQEQYRRCVRDFYIFLDKKFSDIKSAKWDWLFMYEMGVLMEKRAYYVDAQKYYEWAENKTLDVDLTRELEIRWIICRIKQAKTHEDDLDKYNSTISLALDKIRDLGLTDVINPNDDHFPDFKFGRWGDIYKAVMSLPSDKQKPARPKPADMLKTGDKNKDKTEDKAEGKAEDKAEDKAGDTSETHQTDAAKPRDRGGREPLRRHRGPWNQPNQPGRKDSRGPVRKPMFRNPNKDDGVENVGILTEGMLSGNRKPDEAPQKVEIKAPLPAASESAGKEKKAGNVFTDYTLHDYRFKFNPGKDELSIKLDNDEEDLFVKIKQGNFPKDGDFALKEDGRIIKTEDESPTPFKYARDEQGITITDTENGMTFKFPRS